MEAAAVPPVIETGLPLPAIYVADTFPLILFFAPTLVPITSTAKEHELEADKFKAVMPIVLLPALAVIVAAQLPLK